ncbi:hypothetical protein PSTT_01468, partial [Puccinia striiformis]
SSIQDNCGNQATFPEASGLLSFTNEETGSQPSKGPSTLIGQVSYDQKQFTTTQEGKRTYGATELKQGPIPDLENRLNKNKSEQMEELYGLGGNIEIPSLLQITLGLKYHGNGTQRFGEYGYQDQNDCEDDLHSTSGMEKPQQTEPLEIGNRRQALLDWYYDSIFTDTEEHPPLLGSTNKKYI